MKRKKTRKRYEVERQSSIRRKNDDNEYEYEVKWKDYDDSYNTWESLDNLKNSMELVVLYEQNNVEVPSSLSNVSDTVVENKCTLCDYVGVNYADLCIHMSSVHKMKVPARSCVPDIYELDSSLIYHLQQQESQFKIIYDTNLGDNMPTTISSKEHRMLLSHEFIIGDDNLLYCIAAPDSRMKSRVRTQLRLCIPKTIRKSILQQVHNGHFSPHIGVVHTYDKLRENVWWPSMLKDVNEYIKLCDVCMKNKGNQIPMPVQPMSVPNGPFEHVCVDIIGPLPVTDRGYMYMLIAVDRFSRYADGWPMQDQQTKTVTLTFINGWVCKHGIPLIVGSDRGSPFMSHLASDLYKELGIKKVKTTAYHPQSNGIVERFQ